ncbi:class I SAM-dependent methyltransferase [Streptomyces sp. ACA25]|uniref:class I SAM-dependent methyltransferase n=1 Tax=Streptomyces sp. ACA25 TaxID=3022596 RepID=UPI00230832B3|nr:class I SAM-dependent methyltransferase [Streptomyces sp. ACA25]MDB1086068.1 class I SAM-dependent methyltransferase [Streptomyces sp. ACA25]
MTAPTELRTVQDIGYGREFDGFYDRIFPQDANAERAAEQLAAWHPQDGSPTLEFGVGTGRIARPLARLAGEVVGVDSSPEMLTRLRAAVAADDGPGEVTAVHGDIREYTDERSYGLVYCVCATLSMLLDPAHQQAAISRAAERLAPGGTLVVETANRDGMLALHEGRQRTSFFVPYPQPNTGLQTYSTLLPGDQHLWHASHIWYENGTSRVGSEMSRLTSPDEVDAYAAVAGLEPAGRQADWVGTPYTALAPMFISRYVRPGVNGDGRAAG